MVDRTPLFADAVERLQKSQMKEGRRDTRMRDLCGEERAGRTEAYVRVRPMLAIRRRSFTLDEQMTDE